VVRIGLAGLDLLAGELAAICSNDNDVFSTSQTAVAFGISGAWDMSCNLLGRRAAQAGRARTKSSCAPNRAGPEQLVSQCEETARNIGA
jgi:hypothetical protein